MKSIPYAIINGKKVLQYWSEERETERGGGQTWKRGKIGI